MLLSEPQELRPRSRSKPAYMSQARGLSQFQLSFSLLQFDALPNIAKYPWDLLQTWRVCWPGVDWLYKNIAWEDSPPCLQPMGSVSNCRRKTVEMAEASSLDVISKLAPLTWVQWLILHSCLGGGARASGLWLTAIVVAMGRFTQKRVQSADCCTCSVWLAVCIQHCRSLAGGMPPKKILI